MSPAPPTPSLHPSLHRLAATHRRRLRLLGLLFFLVMTGALVFLMSTALTGGDLGSLLLLVVMGGFMLLTLVLMGGLIWYLDHWLAERLHVADRLLRDCQPLTARLVPVGSEIRAGMLAELHSFVGGAVPEERVHVVINPSFRWTAPPRQEIEVQIYCRQLAPGNELVALQFNGTPLLGKVVDREVYERQLRWLKIAVLVALGAMLAGIWVFGGNGAATG